MKKTIAVVLALILLLCGFAALAEDAGDAAGLHIKCGIEDGNYVIRFPVEDEGWVADDMAQDDSVVRLESAEIVDGTFVVRYAPVADGDVSVGVRHFDGIACDKALFWDLRVEDGAVRECVGGSHTESPDEADMDPVLCGEWLEAETQFTQMTIEKNPEKGWDVEVISPVSHGAYVFQATMFYDCELDKFVYDGGRFYDVPITDSSDAELGDPIVTDATGAFEIEAGADDIRLSWYNSQSPEETVVFERMESDSAEETDAAEGRTVEPMPETVDLENGAYPAAFDRARLADGALALNIFTVDCYDIVDISTLAVGDTIVIEGAPVKVEMLERQEDLLVNGGNDAGGFDLRPYEEDNCWKVVQYDDYPTYTDHGEATLPLADDVTFTDGWDIEKDPVTVTGAEAVAKAIAESENDAFVVYNTTVEIAGGKITRIERSYMP